MHVLQFSPIGKTYTINFDWSAKTTLLVFWLCSGRAVVSECAVGASLRSHRYHWPLTHSLCHLSWSSLSVASSSATRTCSCPSLMSYCCNCWGLDWRDCFSFRLWILDYPCRACSCSSSSRVSSSRRPTIFSDDYRLTRSAYHMWFVSLPPLLVPRRTICRISPDNLTSAFFKNHQDFYS